uniref:Salivary secreted peptide n=1 Tax=Haemonchus contortus TaxID=6289 RepID=A0A7I4YZF8_HAECO
MSSIVAVIFFLLASVAVQGSEEQLPKVALEALMEVNMDYSESLEWNEDLVKEALKNSKSPGKAEADLKIAVEQKISNTKKPIALRMITMFKRNLDRKREEIRALGDGAQFGCNGVINKMEPKSSVSALCLYKRKSA